MAAGVYDRHGQGFRRAVLPVWNAAATIAFAWSSVITFASPKEELEAEGQGQARRATASDAYHARGRRGSRLRGRPALFRTARAISPDRRVRHGRDVDHDGEREPVIREGRYMGREARDLAVVPDR